MKKVLIIIFMFFLVGCSNTEGNDNTISYIEAKEKIINEGAILVDVRTKEEYDTKHISGAVLLTLDTIDEETSIDIIDDKDTPVIVYCQSGNRSNQALTKLESLGYTNVYDLGSIDNWEE